ncbi:MAG: hypothetical protein ABSD38_30360 [Syntrophorhabdales bacterium]
MKIRRIAAGHGPDGKSRVASDTLVAPATVTLSPGTEFFTLWGGDNLPSFPDDGSPHGFSTYFPPPGGFRFCVTTVAPAGGEARDPRHGGCQERDGREAAGHALLRHHRLYLRHIGRDLDDPR